MEGLLCFPEKMRARLKEEEDAHTAVLSDVVAALVSEEDASSLLLKKDK